MSRTTLVQIRLSVCGVWTRYRELKDSAFICYTGRPERSFLDGVPTWSLDATFYALPTLFLPSASRDHGGGSGILRQPMFQFRQMRMFFKAGDLLRCFIEAAPVLQAILIVSEVTSGAALTGVADLKAVPEVTQTKPI